MKPKGVTYQAFLLHAKQHHFEIYLSDIQLIPKRKPKSTGYTTENRPDINQSWIEAYDKLGARISTTVFRRRYEDGETGVRLLRPTPNMYRPNATFLVLLSLIKAVGKSPADFENHVAIETGGISRITHGVYEPTVDEKHRIARALNLTADELWGEFAYHEPETTLPVDKPEFKQEPEATPPVDKPEFKQEPEATLPVDKPEFKTDTDPAIKPDIEIDLSNLSFIQRLKLLFGKKKNTKK